ncbi:MAG: glycosyltransferase family 2 protein [Chloroflexota bacterium]|nr:MAG: glycosyltransferase family 2 protein [Chloroflexota bacterium]
MTNTVGVPFLSIVIPAYNEQNRIVGTLHKIAEYLSQQDYTAEVLVVDDGSADATYRRAVEFAEGSPIVRVLRKPHLGKGGAVRTGMLAARGEFRFLCDADLSMPISEVHKFLPPERGSVDVAIGSREATGAHRHDEPGYRHLMGRVFNMVVRSLVIGGFRDTQCGFKCFRGQVAEDLFQLQRSVGFGFDVEILFLASRLKYRVEEVPIDWYHVGESKVRPVTDAFQMFREATTVRLNDILGRYDYSRCRK